MKREEKMTKMEIIDFDKSFRKPLIIVGSLLFILGLLGVIFPNLFSLAISIYLGWLMLFAGLIWLYYSFKLHVHSFSSWIKPIILLVAAGLWLFYPVAGIAALTLLIAFYIFSDAFGSFAMAFERRGNNGWGWMLLNGIISLLLGILILFGWPATSIFILGIFVGISLLFDGIALIMLGMALKAD